MLSFWGQTAPVLVAELVHQKLSKVAEVLAALQQSDWWLVCTVWIHAVRQSIQSDSVKEQFNHGHGREGLCL